MPIELSLDASAWNPLVALVFCTALLWVGAAVAWEATAPGALRTRSLDLVSVVLLAAGLWWPAHVSTAFHAGDGLFVVALMVTLGAGTAFLARLGVLAPWHHPQQLLGTGGVLLASLAFVSVLHSLPGSGLPWTPLGLLGCAVAMTIALRALHRPLRAMPAHMALRSASALMAGAVLTAVTWRSSTPGPALDATLVPMGALTTMGAFLAVSLRQARRQRQAERLSAAPAADIDVLTGLPNRSALESRLAQAVARCDSERRRLALLIVNLDGFKPVNATYGHVIGDQVLKQASRRMRSLMQPKDMLARLGGDAFAVLLTHQAEREPLARLAERLIDAIGQPYRLGTKEVHLTGSVGIALYPDHGDAERLIARAETAVHTAKRAGGARAGVFTSDMDEDMTQDLELLRDLRHALDNDGLGLVFQPKIDAASGSITAAEALLRWRHATRGDVPPATFVALAERFGLVIRLGDWVIDRACRTAGAWAQKGLNMRVAINLSAQHLREPGLAQRIGQALTRNRIEPSRLTCEITETLAMENTPGDAGDLGTARVARRAPVDRRLRHRLLEPGLPASAARQGDQDRPQLRDRPGAQRRRPCRGRRRGEAGSCLGQARRRRRRGDGQATTHPHRARLRRAAGLPVRAADDGRRPAAVGAGCAQQRRGRVPFIAVRSPRRRRSAAASQDAPARVHPLGSRPAPARCRRRWRAPRTRGSQSSPRIWRAISTTM